MAKHGVVRTDLLAGTDVRSELVSVRYQPSNTMTAIDNGNIVALGELEVDGSNVRSRTVYKGLTPTANNTISDVVLVASPEVMYDERLKGLENYYNEAGKISRGYRLHEHDIFGVTADALSFTGTIAVGNGVEIQAGTKLKVTATVGEKAIGKIIDINVVGRYTYYAIEIN